MKNNNSIINVVLILLLVALGIFLFREITNREPRRNQDSDQIEASHKSKQATVSGNIIFTGLKPTEGDKGYIGIEYKKASDTTFTNANVELPLINNSPFLTDKATEGQTYDVKAFVTINDKKVATSELIRVTAPATNVQIPIDVTWEDLPDEVVQEYPVSLDGTVTINGYIPENSKVRMYYKQTNEPTYITSEPDLNAEKVVKFDITNALNGRSYKIYSELYDASGTSIGTSTVVAASAPAEDVEITLNSNAVKPQPKEVTINGYIVLNGMVDESKNMEIYLRDLESDQVTTIASLEPKTNSWWSYAEALEGRQYRVNAMAVAANGTSVYSKAVEFTAPATNIELVIDTGTYLEPPTDDPTLVSCTEVKDGVEKAKIEFDNVSRATRYWLQIGSDSGTNDVYDAVQNGPKKDEPLFVEVDIKEDESYYARYAYSFCTDSCSSPQSFSDFSESLKFECPEDDD